MFKNQSSPATSSVLINSMEELFEFIDTSTFHPFISNSSLNWNSELEQDAIERIYTDLKTVEKLIDDPNMSFPHLHTDGRMNSKVNFSKSISSIDISDDSQSSLASIHSQSSDNDDDEPFDREEWIVKDPLSHKPRPPKLYEFLQLLLRNSRYVSYASWLSNHEGLFKIHKPAQTASLWEKVKARKTNGSMDYNIFARGIRYYYKSGLMIKTHIKYTYCFASI